MEAAAVLVDARAGLSNKACYGGAGEAQASLHDRRRFIHRRRRNWWMRARPSKWCAAADWGADSSAARRGC